MSHIKISMQKQSTGVLITCRCSHDVRDEMIDFIQEIDEPDYIKTGSEIASDEEIVIQFSVEDQDKIDELKMIFDSTLPEEPPLFDYSKICLN